MPTLNDLDPYEATPEPLPADPYEALYWAELAFATEYGEWVAGEAEEEAGS